jgi:hypothetical protein
MNSSDEELTEETFHGDLQSRGSVVSNKTKVPKQDSQNRLRSSISEGGEP